MYNLFAKTPFAAFLFFSIVLTNTSVFFPQNLGEFQKVAGWPLVMYKVEYRLAGDIEPTGKLTHWLSPDKNQVMWEKVFLNILLWTVLLQGTWWFYQKLEEPKVKVAQ